MKEKKKENKNKKKYRKSLLSYNRKQ